MYHVVLFGKEGWQSFNAACFRSYQHNMHGNLTPLYPLEELPMSEKLLQKLVLHNQSIPFVGTCSLHSQYQIRVKLWAAVSVSQIDDKINSSAGFY